MTAPTGSLIPGTFNARDLGGLRAGDRRLAPGRLLRSDAPVGLGGDGRAAISALGVAAAIDLREPIEREQAPPDLELTAGLGAPDGLMRDVLKRLAADGGAEAYLRRRGLRETTPARLASARLEP